MKSLFCWGKPSTEVFEKETQRVPMFVVLDSSIARVSLKGVECFIIFKYSGLLPFYFVPSLHLRSCLISQGTHICLVVSITHIL